MAWVANTAVASRRVASVGLVGLLLRRARALALAVSVWLHVRVCRTI